MLSRKVNRLEKSTNTEGIDRLLRLDEVLRVTGMGRNTVHTRIREGTFPKQVKIGPNSVAWRQSDITQWMTSFGPSDDQSVH
ncbi:MULTISPECIES: helix-turn-helix transcriptional regulator [Pseudomonas]|uniref:helix-turn-helix transcriptional regulator n=1 Tax=Pseudomonas TaxID=286 RepID=UPI001CE48B2F|nr:MULTISPECIES: AlpA family transcriptional regulator [Pseudomonas]MCU7219347.1 AlpA family transcriptional regulator [Pseudomonas brassicacearum]